MSVGKVLLKFLKKHIAPTIMFATVIVGVIASSLLPPLALRGLIDNGLKSPEKLSAYALFYFGSFVLIGITDVFKKLLTVYFAENLSKELRINMLNAMQKMPYTTFIKEDIGQYESYFSNDVNAINSLLSSGAIELFIDLFKIIGIVTTIFVFNVYFGLITVALLPILALIAIAFRRKMFGAQLINRKLESNVNETVLETVDNITTVKSFGAYGYFLDKYSKLLSTHYKNIEKTNFYDSVFPPLMSLIKSVGIAVIVMFATKGYGVFGLSAGILIAFIDFLTNIFAPIESLGMELQTIQKSMAGVKRVDIFLKKNVPSRVTNQTLERVKKYTIKFENVSFGYENETKILDNFNLTIETPQKVALLGESGAGKSTVVKLAYGMIAPDRGKVTVNGVNSAELSAETRAETFGILFQDAYFCGGTVKEELTLLNSADDSACIEALKKVGLERLSLTQKSVESQLSNGEKYLFNLARIVLKAPPIWFLDELNGKLDPETLDKVMEVVDAQCADCMVISINHYGKGCKNSEFITILGKNER